MRKSDDKSAQGSLFGDTPERITPSPAVRPAPTAKPRARPAGKRAGGIPGAAKSSTKTPTRSSPTARPAAAHTPERKVLTVSGLNRDGRRLLESTFASIWIEGEISNFSAPASGHWYFSLKDAQSQVRVAMFRNSRSRVRLRPKDGMEVLLRGKVTLYEARGEFQLVAEHIEETGEGALRAAFEALKSRLASEGLFDPQRKRELPAFPKRVGVVTSPTGAAVRDVINVLKRRFPAMPVRIYPIPVQGAEAAPRIVQALRLARRRADCDVLIVGRGGGSLEDLWAFNEEIVARAIADCEIPIISAVGHEVDFTIADFVADVRAPTPSGAAEIVVPDQDEWKSRFQELATSLSKLIQRTLEDRFQSVDWLSKRLAQCSPAATVARQGDQLRNLRQIMLSAVRADLASRSRRLESMRLRLMQRSPAVSVQQRKNMAASLEQRLTAMGQNMIRSPRERLRLVARTLHSVSPLATLDRGYAIVSELKSGAVLTDSDSVATGTTIEARLASGALLATVTGKKELENES